MRPKLTCKATRVARRRSSRRTTVGVDGRRPAPTRTTIAVACALQSAGRSPGLPSLRTQGSRGKVAGDPDRRCRTRRVDRTSSRHGDGRWSHIPPPRPHRGLPRAQVRRGDSAARQECRPAQAVAHRRTDAFRGRRRSLVRSTEDVCSSPLFPGSSPTDSLPMCCPNPDLAS